MRVRGLWLGLLLTGCPAATPGDGGTSSGSDASVGSGESMASNTELGDSTVADTGTSGAMTTTVGTTAGSTDGGSSGMTTDDSSSETGIPPPPPKSCALATIDPAADPTMVIDIGTEVGQIPPSVGDVLLRNCGCHYTDNVTPGEYVDYKSNKVPMATQPDFHLPYAGTFPMGYADEPAYVGIEQRVVFHNPLPMPPHPCGVEGEVGTIPAADLQVLTDWLAAAAPDGTAWP
ncbi:MAG: hypothetical protein K1X88_33190 [Nannocystaceae bacterium]|nr:hypothetical protein [Nannocystaceae bacterium]